MAQTRAAMTEDTSRSLSRRDERRHWTVLELLRAATAFFEERGLTSSRLDAECLLALVLGCDRIALYVDFERPVLPEERSRFRELARQRAILRVPVAQLVGCREFWSLSFEVNTHVLIPRPETETLVECALAHLDDPGAAAQVLDLGTGSGCIALSIASERPATSVVATDVSEAALEVASRNALKHGLEGRVRFLRGDLFLPLSGERFDLVVSNPPYVARRDAQGLAPELAFEPDEALFGGEDGLDVVRRLLAGVEAHLVAGGRAAIEMDPRQESETRELFDAAGLSNIEALRDLSGRSRVMTGVRA